MIRTDPATCRARIACTVNVISSPVSLGDIVLRPHQLEALGRVHARLDAVGGCLLADDVGHGKTYVALAASRRWSRPLFVIPAALRDTWTIAMRRAGLSHPLHTHEALSRGVHPSFEPDGIVVDESHHFRNPGTRRHAMLADVAAHAELLLLSATPVQNRDGDLAAQLSLFLGSPAMRLDDQQRARHVVRGSHIPTTAKLPALAPPRWVQPRTDDADVLRAILALPPPPRALDAGDAGALRTISLVRAWASSRAALASTLARRRRVATAIEQGVDAGRVPSRAELRAWHGADDVQLGFASLLMDRVAGDEALDVLRRAIASEQRALRELGTLLRERPDVDRARADALIRVARAHPGARVVAFTELAATARALFALLAAQPGVALLSAADARIASGRITRRELLVRFAPAGHGADEPPLRERVSLLICTDLLSEGVNLQDASVVVHLDLPWNPARLAQRVGRARRPGGSAPVVTSYLLAPPATTELLLDVETRLRHKLAAAQRTLGPALSVVPSLTLSGLTQPPCAPEGDASRLGALHARLTRWAAADSETPDVQAVTVSAVHAAEPGWIAALKSGRLVASVGDAIGDDAELLTRAAELAEGDPRAGGADAFRSALTALTAYLQRARLLEDCGANASRAEVADRCARYASVILASAPRHERPTLAALTATLRAQLDVPLTLGAERALERWLGQGAEVLPALWLATAITITTPRRRGRQPGASDHAIALIRFGP